MVEGAWAWVHAWVRLHNVEFDAWCVVRNVGNDLCGSNSYCVLVWWSSFLVMEVNFSMNAWRSFRKLCWIRNLNDLHDMKVLQSMKDMRMKMRSLWYCMCTCGDSMGIALGDELQRGYFKNGRYVYWLRLMWACIICMTRLANPTDYHIHDTGSYE